MNIWLSIFRGDHDLGPCSNCTFSPFSGLARQCENGQPEHFRSDIRHVLGREAESFKHFDSPTACPKPVHCDNCSIRPDPALPAERGGRFDGDMDRSGVEHALLVLF
jgi:hypothetical protein